MKEVCIVPYPVIVYYSQELTLKSNFAYKSSLLTSGINQTQNDVIIPSTN